jgi:hypothetical protein
MALGLDLVNAVAKDLGPSAALVLNHQAKALGKTPATLTREDLDKLAAGVYNSVSKTLGPAIAENVKNSILALKNG